MSVVGIDFGYQTCYVAVARQGGVETVANEYSDRCTPSCVAFGEKERILGVAAKNQMVTNRKNSVWGFKKLLGRPFNDPQVQQERPKLSYDVVEGPDGSTGIQVQYLGEEQVFSPEQITATMLGKLREVASAALSTKVVDCVVSVPSYFTDIERRALLDAGQVAGLNILSLINDTTASALSYGIYKQDLPEEADKPRVVVFVDMGHSSLQVAACAFNKGKLKVLAKVNDPNLGGRDFDELIANHIADEFKKTYRLDVRSNGRAWLRLLQESEKLKKLMSQNTSAVPMNIECFMEDKDVTYSMKRKDMETLAESLLARVDATLREILTAAKLSPDDLFGVEIIGGSTRIPAVKELVKSVFGKEPFTTLNADEAVARGCALQCAILSPVFRVREFSITDCQPYSVTLKWTGSGLEEADNEMEVFTQYHPIPFSKMLTFYRKEPFALHACYTHPPNVPISQPQLGKFVISKIVPDATTGENSKVKVKVRVNANGVFSINEASMSEKVESQPEPEAPTKAAEAESASMDTTPPTAGDQPKTAEGGDKMDVDQGPPTPSPSDQQPPFNGQTAPAGDEESAAGAEKMDEDKPEKGGKGKKIKVRWVDLPITPHVPQMTKDKIQLLIEKEVQMQAQDKQEKERADSKNAVEEYVLEMRKHLSDKYEPFVREDDKDKFMALLSSTEDWLYDEGEDQQKSVYVDKLVQMRKLGDPIAKRYAEAMDRPLAFDELGLALQLVRKALEAYNQKDDKYSHLEPADIEKVEKCVTEKAAWYEQKLKDVDSHSTYDDPVVLASQIRMEKKLLDSTVNPILNKPKPKPKQEPPKPEAQTNGPEGKGDAPPQSAETGADKPQPDTAEKPSAMDLD